MRRVLSVGLIVGLLVVSGCGGADDGAEIQITDDELSTSTAHWPNLTGLMQTDPDVWRPRLQRACSQGAWDSAVAERLAAEFIEDDLPLSVRDDGSMPEVAEGALAVWLMARNTCGELFPAEAIEQGPPTP